MSKLAATSTKHNHHKTSPSTRAKPLGAASTTMRQLSEVLALTCSKTIITTITITHRWLNRDTTRTVESSVTSSSRKSNRRVGVSIVLSRINSNRITSITPIHHRKPSSPRKSTSLLLWSIQILKTLLDHPNTRL